MLEISPHQASGLLTLDIPKNTRFMAMVKHADSKFELPLLWQLSSAMVGLGYTVTVLDATTAESQAQPGLEQLLEDDFHYLRAHIQTQGWNIIPAATGLQSLATLKEQNTQGLDCLGQIFQRTGVVLVYAPSDCLISLFSHYRIKPLLAVAPARRYLLSSYGALKHLLLGAGIEPAIVNLVQGGESEAENQSVAMASALSTCAETFLGCEVKISQINVRPDDDASHKDIQHLALRMLEDALVLEPGLSMFTQQTRRDSRDTLDQFEGSH